MSLLLNAIFHHSLLFIPQQEIPGVVPSAFVMRHPESGDIEVSTRTLSVAHTHSLPLSLALFNYYDRAVIVMNKCALAHSKLDCNDIDFVACTPEASKGGWGLCYGQLYRALSQMGNSIKCRQKAAGRHRAHIDVRLQAIRLHFATAPVALAGCGCGCPFMWPQAVHTHIHTRKHAHVPP